jgi:hypothetical protein
MTLRIIYGAESQLFKYTESKFCTLLIPNIPVSFKQNFKNAPIFSSDESPKNNKN